MPLNNISISVIIPVFNNGSALQRAIDSCLNQIYQPSEIILVDNNSTDNSSELISSNVNSHPELIKALKETQPGANAARNAGIKLARGTWIQFLDADDELEPQKIQNQVDLIIEEPFIDVIYSKAKYYVFNESKKEFVFFKNYEIDPDPIKGLIQSKLGRIHSNLWKKSSLENVNLFGTEKTSSQEYFLMLKLFTAGAIFKYDSSNFSKIYMQKESISITNIPKKSIHILKNKLIFNKNLREILQEKNILNLEYKNLLKIRATQEFYSVYLSQPIIKSELLLIKEEFQLQFAFQHVFRIYAYSVHNNYNKISSKWKYLTLIPLLFIHASKLKVK
ncbi:MAG: glycosyltransferase family 2 protein [Saprospiraceae bacterium]